MREDRVVALYANSRGCDAQGFPVRAERKGGTEGEAHVCERRVGRQREGCRYRTSEKHEM